MKKKVTILTAVALVAAATAAMAFTAPAAATDFGYDFFDTANKLSTGAPGFAIGIGGLVMAGFFLFRQQVLPAAGCVFGVITILKSTSIVTSLGINI